MTTRPYATIKTCLSSHVNKLNGRLFLKRRQHFKSNLKINFLIEMPYFIKRWGMMNWLTESPIVFWVSGVIDCFLWCWSCGVLVFQCKKVLINAKSEVDSSAYFRQEILDLWCKFKFQTWSGKIAHIDGASKCCWTMKCTTSGVQRDGGSSSLPTTVL